MIKTIMVCDQCGKEQDNQTAENWIDVKPMGHYVATFSNAFSSPDVYGLYCGAGCLIERLATKAIDFNDLVEYGKVKWQGVEYRVT